MSSLRERLFANQRLPIILQSEASECGLACLAMIASYYGRETTLTSLRSQFNVSLRGMTLATMANIANGLGLMSRSLKVDMDAIGHVQTPAILHWDRNHFVVLKTVGRNHVVISDPRKGLIKLTEDEFSEHFTGIAMELQPAVDFAREKASPALKIQSLWGAVTGLKRSLVLLLLLTIMLQVSALLSPLFLQFVVDDVLTHRDTSLLVMLVVGFSGLAILDAATKMASHFVNIYLGNTLSFQMASNLFRHLLSLPTDYFEKRYMGDINSRFSSLSPIRTLVTEQLVSGSLDLVLMLAIAAMMIAYSPLLAAITFVALLGFLVLRTVLYQVKRKLEEKVIVTSAKESTTFMEAVRSMTTIKLFGGEVTKHRQWQNLFADSINAKVRLQRYENWFSVGQNLLTSLELIAVIYFAARMVLAGDMTVGMIFAFQAFRNNFVTKAHTVIDLLIQYRVLGLHLERISDIVHSEPEPASKSLATIQAKPIDGSIELRDVSFRYAFDQPKTLDQLSLKIDAGSSVAIVGPTGCGKTTLLKVMASLITPEDGEILIDGKPLGPREITAYRGQIGVVMQDDALMSGSIAENIAFFDPELDMQRIIEAAKTACILDDILALPMQFQSLIGEMGTSLSGGQRQRLAIARALYRKPRILFMDEGTSNLDVGTEDQVNRAVAAMDITRVIIAHRSETIKSADVVYKMEQGRLSRAEGAVTYNGSTIDLSKRRIPGSNSGRSAMPLPEKEVGT